MPKISLESGSIQIELTRAEVGSYGFGLTQSQCLRKKRSPSGGVLLELFSIDLTKTSESSEVVALIPPAVIFPGSSGSPAQSIPRPDAQLSSSESARLIPASEQASSNGLGYHPHRNDRLVNAPETTGNLSSTCCRAEPKPSSPLAVESLGVMPPRSRRQPA